MHTERKRPPQRRNSPAMPERFNTLESRSSQKSIPPSYQGPARWGGDPVYVVKCEEHDGRLLASLELDRKGRRYRVEGFISAEEIKANVSDIRVFEREQRARELKPGSLPY